MSEPPAVGERVLDVMSARVGTVTRVEPGITVVAFAELAPFTDCGRTRDAAIVDWRYHEPRFYRRA